MSKKKTEKTSNHPGYISLDSYELEEGTKDNLKIGAEYIISLNGINIKQKYFKYIIRRRLEKRTRVEGVYIFDGETEEEYKNYVDYIKFLINKKAIFKLNRK